MSASFELGRVPFGAVLRLRTGGSCFLVRSVHIKIWKVITNVRTPPMHLDDLMTSSEWSQIGVLSWLGNQLSVC
jgi:hypothetical protein